MSRAKCIGIAGVVLTVAFIAWLFIREQSRPRGLVVGPFLRAADARFSIAVTNASHRKITYQVSGPVFNQDGAWGVPRQAPQFMISNGWSPTLASRGTPEVLAAATVGTSRVDRPMFISISREIPDGARAWRVAIIWSYTTPSLFEKVHAKVVGLFQRNAVAPQTYTNYSSEISL